MTWHPDRLWHRHPAVTKGTDRSLGQRAADLMKRVLATWGALGAVLWFIAAWMLWNSGPGEHVDPFPWILLNLFLSCFAALQCFVLLIANKRGEQIAAQVAEHTLENTQQLTEQVRQLASAVHAQMATPTVVVTPAQLQPIPRTGWGRVWWPEHL